MFRVCFAAIFLNEYFVNAVIRIIGAQEKPIKYIYEQGCYLKSLDEIIPFNSSYLPTNHNLGCVQYFCDYDEFIYVNECINSLEGECTLVKGNASLPYPYCCDYCEPLNKKSNNVSLASESNSITALPNVNQTDLNTFINKSNRVPKPESENKTTRIPNAKTRENLDKTDENVKSKDNVNNNKGKHRKLEAYITPVDKIKIANKSDTGLENIPEAKPDNKSENNLESEKEKESNTQPGDRQETDTESKLNIISDKTENKSGTKPDNKLEANTQEAQLESQTENQTEAKSENEEDNEFKAVVEKKSETKPEAESERKSTNNEENESQTNSEKKSEKNPETKSETTTSSGAKN